MSNEKTPTPGWQQRAVPQRKECLHVGVMFAQMVAHQHAEGHEWVCSCGTVFTVVSNGGRDKRLVKKVGI